MLWYQFVAHTGPKANTNKTQTQADLRGSPKPGTSTEATDCILMEEWYKHSTQPNTTHENQCFTLTLFSLKSSLAFTLTVALTTLLCTLASCTHSTFSTLCTLSRLSLYRWMEKHWQQPMCRTNYYNDKSHGGWRKVDKKCWQLLHEVLKLVKTMIKLNLLQILMVICSSYVLIINNERNLKCGNGSIRL